MALSSVSGLSGLSALFGAFSPADIPGLALWLGARFITGKNDGDAVSTWTDQSGNGRDAGQVTGTKQPLYKTNIISGRPVLRFDLTDDCLATSAVDFSSTAGLTLFVVAANIGSATDRIIFESSANFNTNIGAFILFRDTGNKLNLNTIGNVGGNPTVGTTNVTSAATVITGVYNMALAANAETQLYVNGTAEGSHTGGTNNTGNFGNYAINIGSRNNGASNPLGGDIAEILLYNTALASANRLLVERYLGAQYGITVA